MRPILLSIIAATCINISLQAQPYCINANLVMCVHFNGHANDTCGNISANQVNGTTWTTGHDGTLNGALAFDGQNDFVEYLHSPVIDFGNAEPFTVSVWVKQSMNQNWTDLDDNTIITKQLMLGGAIPNQGTGGYPFTLRTANQTAGLQHGAVSGIRYDGNTTSGGCLNASKANSIGTYNDDQWHHYALVRSTSNNKLRLYIDGILQQEVDDISGTGSPSCTTTNNAPLLLGTSSASSRFFTGAIDELRIYNRELEVWELEVLGGIPCVVSVTDIEPKISVMIHPNPSSGLVTIDLEQPNLINECLVRNSTGQLIHTLELRNETQLIVELPRQQAGVYLLQFLSEQGEILLAKQLILE